jgi:integrase
MGRRSVTGGVRPKGAGRIEVEFTYQGRRYRPTIARKPTPANLRKAHVKLASIDRAISEGTFDFAREFPNYRLKSRAPTKVNASEPAERSKTCGEVFDAFLAHCENRVRLGDLAHSTLESYRQMLECVWRPRLGNDTFLDVRYSRLQSVLASYVTHSETIRSADRSKSAPESLSKRTYNNLASALRCAFGFGYEDHLDKHNPAVRLRTLRITQKDKAPIDPFTIQEAETIITRSHAEFGEAHGNYEEFRFFTGLRPSEQFALKLADYDRAVGTLSVRRACVRKREKDRTKTGKDRKIELCARAQSILERQLALRERLVRSGRITHDFLFFQEDGAPLRDLSYPYRRWRHVLNVSDIRYRTPYHARHSFTSWSIMLGKNLLKLAIEDGHSLQTMLSTYAGWTERATDADVAVIRKAINEPPGPVNIDGAHRERDVVSIRDRRPTSRTRGRLSWRGFESRAAPDSLRPNARFEVSRISWRRPQALAPHAVKLGATR